VPKSKAEKQAELKTLDNAIAERKIYHRQQEALINEACESGNSELMSLDHDIVVAKQALRDLKTDIRTAALDKVLLNNDLDHLRQEAEDLVGSVV
jgi:chromosome segregation ATPase